MSSFSFERSKAAPLPEWTPAPSVHDVLRSPGRPLEPTVRGAMESRFSHDFSQVRVHTGARAADSARANSAQAYTVGQDIVFGNGSYSPGTVAGDSILAHELAHVVQQSREGRGEHAESEAQAASQAVTDGALVDSGRLSGAPIGLYRLADDSQGEDRKARRQRRRAKRRQRRKERKNRRKRGAEASKDPEPIVERDPATQSGLFIRVTKRKSFEAKHALSGFAPGAEIDFFLASPGRITQTEEGQATLRWKPAGSSQPMAEEKAIYLNFPKFVASPKNRSDEVPGFPFPVSEGDTQDYGLNVKPGKDCEDAAKSRSGVVPYDRLKSDWRYEEKEKYTDEVTFRDNVLPKSTRVYEATVRLFHIDGEAGGSIEYRGQDELLEMT